MPGSGNWTSSNVWSVVYVLIQHCFVLKSLLMQILYMHVLFIWLGAELLHERLFLSVCLSFCLFFNCICSKMSTLSCDKQKSLIPLLSSGGWGPRPLLKFQFLLDVFSQLLILQLITRLRKFLHRMNRTSCYFLPVVHPLKSGGCTQKTFLKRGQFIDF